VIRAGAALARDEDPARAAAEAAERAAEAVGATDAALVFAAGHGPETTRVAAAAAEALGTRAIAGAAGHGVLAGLEEEEERPAVAILALAGLEATPFRMADLAGAEDAAGAELEAALGRSARETDLVVLFADPVALDARRLLAACDEVLPPGGLVGAAAAIGPDGRPGLTWSGREPLAGGASGLVLHLANPARVLVSHGCRPITGVLPVTRADGHWILELDGRPALDVYREAAGELLAADLRRTAELVVAALPRTRAGDEFVVRTVAGFAPDRRAFALAEDLRPGTPLRLALRDADLAREDLTRALGASTPSAAALYLSCSGRGRGLFRHAGLEAAVVARALGPTPLAGLFGSFQLGPVAGATELHTYAAVLTLLP
jgi:small ligand-binding sensory domain FIST